MASEVSRTIVFRADASVAVGNGHVMRCLALADRLRRNGYRCHFICSDQAGHLGALITGHGHTVSLLAAEPGCATGIQDDAPSAPGWRADADRSVAILRQLSPRWLVVDNYSLDARWEREVAPYCERLMVIDDLADRPHECDFLLDQSLGRGKESYVHLVPAPCEVALGPRYALLRPQFSATRSRSLARRVQPALHHVLISMGGSDHGNATGRALEALAEAGLPDSRLTIVMGGKSPGLAEVREQARRHPGPVRVVVDAQDMANLIADADLAIGGGGMTAWERCCLGVPAVLVLLADNQKGTANALESIGAVEFIGGPADIDLRLGPALQRLQNPATLSRMSAAASAVVDGLGTERIAERMEVLDG